MLPIGALFGVLTTRGLIRRVERLANAAAQFWEGDETQGVPVDRPDEIGQLERQFNQMAERIVDNYAERQALAEKIGRQEERARIEQEMRTARYIQEALLPERLPSTPGWQFEPFYRPARQVGGDFYDFLPLPGGRIGIVIGDGTGKGIPAALIMATTTTMLRAAAPHSGSPGAVLAMINNLLQEHIPPNMFITCFYAILDPANGELCFANAGHNLPYLWRAGEIAELRAAGMPLGLMPDQGYEEKTLTLDAGERVLFYTDGLVEAHDPHRTMFGGPRLKHLLQNSPRPDGLIEYVMTDLQAFTGDDWEQEDDITLVLLSREGLKGNSS
jgi:serine phosphatase RsbU (regulator of sigma subunit)